MVVVIASRVIIGVQVHDGYGLIGRVSLANGHIGSHGMESELFIVGLVVEIYVGFSQKYFASGVSSDILPSIDMGVWRSC
jgi:hypothetical protein